MLIPDENVKDLAEIPDNIKGKLEIKPVKWIDEVLQLALKDMPQPLPVTAEEKPKRPTMASVPSPSDRRSVQASRCMRTEDGRDEDPA